MESRNERMEQVLYTKYNSLRQPAYRIVTEIREKDGEKYVVKRAGEPAAEEHMRCMKENRKLLADAYTDVFVLPMEEDKNGIWFPFVYGKDLKDELVEGYIDLDQFIRDAAEKLDRMLAVKPECLREFEPTEAFSVIFGDNAPKGGLAVCPANVDALFTNFMEQDGRLYCIDYEWVFNFAVPVGFIRYRALRYLHYGLGQSLLDSITLAEFLNRFGIGEADQVLFEQMEYRFQFRVHGEKLKYHYLHRYQKAHGTPQERIVQLGDVIQNREEEIANLRKVVKNETDQIEAKEQHIGNLEEIINDLRKDTENKATQIGAQEQHIGNLEEIISDLRKDTENKAAQIGAQEQHIGNLEVIIRERNKAVEDKERHIVNIEHMLANEKIQHEDAEARYQEIANSFYWRMTLPMRKVSGRIKTELNKHDDIYLFLRIAKCRIIHGKQEANKRKEAYLKEKRQNSWYKLITAEEWEQQHKEVFPRKIRFSILVPLYNTPEFFLREMIQSVQNQSYTDWELCLADGSDENHSYVGKICKKAARKDKRIRYQKLKENTGISGNTNACIDMAKGDYIALFDHDDYLHPSALFEVMRTICETGADFVYTDENTFHETPPDAFNPHFKPDFAPDTLRANNYICHLSVFSEELLEKAGKFRPAFDGSQDFDLVLRLTEKAKKIVHIPKVLYYWRAHRNSVAETVDAKPYVIDAAKNAIREHLERVGLKGDVLDSRVVSMYRLKYEIEGNPLISIIIPSYDHADDLKRCIESIREKTTYENYEIIIVENNSTKQETFDYYRELEDDPRIRMVKWDGIFNFSGICNFGVKHSKGEHVLLLNNDVEIITPDWLQEMLMYSQRKDVGAVGAKLYYPDHTIQHAGIGIGLLTLAGHYHRHFDGNHPGYMGRLSYAQDVSAVTGACMMIRRDVYDEMNGYDETFEVAFNDVDFCMRVRKAGYLIVFTPFAELYHYESKSRGLDDAPEKRARFVGEVERFQKRWAKELAEGDPYYNPNFSLFTEDFSFREI